MESDFLISRLISKIKENFRPINLSSATKAMNTEPKIEFHIALNVMVLYPRDFAYWQRCLASICADLANRHAVYTRGWVGAYADPKIGYLPFYLFSLLLDLDEPHELQKYRSVESWVGEAIKSHIKP